MNSNNTNEPIRILASLLIACTLGLASATMIGCDTNDTPGEKIDEAIDDAADAVDDAADDVDDAIDDAADDLDDSVD